ncbi:MAG: GvpL/GvpF family gas vesicle protein [Candidatus Omnitrophota bacterium]|nr:GvpL/GvpF family gas vesicle protein [Candidatus Omnitrophota bacterium]
MDKEGKYIYCIIATSQERNFGPIGIGGRGDDVLTFGYNDLSMVVSSHPTGQRAVVGPPIAQAITKFVVNSDNMLAHERVIEEVMKEFDSVLPVRFGTIASNADEIRNLLGRRYRELKNALRDADHKVELGVKGVWKNMDVIFKEVVDENKAIKITKEDIQNDRNKKNIQAKMEVGKMVEKALEKKKEKEAQSIVDALRRTSSDYKLNKTVGDEMFVNAAFLVDKGREKEFDNIMDDLGEEHKDRVKFMYTGPLPVFNFVNIVIYPEEWEK